jgi:aconitate hydratase
MFTEVYGRVTQGTEQWNALKASNDQLYPWDNVSTYIHYPPYFDGMTKELKPTLKIENASVLLNLGDSITTDHISPAGNISKKSPAGRFLESKG